MQTTLEHIHSLNLNIPEFTYEWDDTNTEVAESNIDEVLLSKLRQLPAAKNAALTFAVAEWVIFIFENIADTSLAKYWIEAAWKGLRDINEIKTTWEELRVEDEWRGSAKGAVDLAMRHVTWALEDLAEPEQSDSALNTVQLIALVRHILPNFSPFEEWLNNNIDFDLDHIVLSQSPENPFLN